MVRYLGSYSQTEASRRTYDTGQASAEYPESQAGGYDDITSNILLEYGEYDLDDIFNHRLPPVLPGEIDTFWRKLYEVAIALDSIHNVSISGAEYDG